ncbi:MAG: hypothetical protein GEU90_10480 [Gemmatimonas sp.]|nr:hypothetical protein [Gemmatimonas sp.]
MRTRKVVSSRVDQSAILLVLLSLAGARELAAQVFTPTYMAPQGTSELGLYISDGPGDFALEGIWRNDLGDIDVGIRAGLADTQDLTLLVGGEIRSPLILADPLEMAVTGHVQGAFGDAEGLGILAGLTLGQTFEVDELAFTPYLHPRLGLVDNLGNDDLDLDLLADFGLDVRITPELDLRLGIGFGSPVDWGIGFAWR